MQVKAARRIEALLDPDSFAEFKTEFSTGFITGKGLINCRKVYVSAFVSEVVPGNVFAGLQHHFKLLEEALQNPAPVILMLDIAGHQPGVAQSSCPENPTKLLADQHGIGHWYALHARLSGKVPQVDVVFARMGASMTFPIALCDAVVMLENTGMSIGRPDVVEKILGEKVDYEKLGGAGMHAEISGSIDMVAKDEKEALTFVRRYLSYLPTAIISIYGKAVAEKLDHDLAQDEIEHRQEMMKNASDLQELVKEGLLDEIIPPENLRDRIKVFLNGKSTGKPKGVTHTHNSLLNAAVNRCQTLKHTSPDSFITTTYICHGAAPSIVMLPMFMAGGTAIFLAQFTLEHFLKMVLQHQTSFTAAARSIATKQL